MSGRSGRGGVRAEGAGARSGGPAARPLEVWALGAFLAFTLVALAGYGIFGLRPARLPEAGPLLAIWGVSFRFFAQAHVIVGALVLGVLLVGRLRARWLPAAGAVCAISFASEYVGTGYGFPFGEYGYTGLLGPRIGGRIPWLIPPSWFLMALPSFALAAVAFGGAAERTRRIGFAVLLLIVWDLALDPAMSWAPPFYWRWGGEGGAYYGMPWMNLFGWALTGTLVMAALERLGAADWTRELPPGWLAGYYGVTLLMPLGMVLLQGLWLAVGTTAAGLLLAVAVGVARQRHRLGVPAAFAPGTVEGS